MPDSVFHHPHRVTYAECTVGNHIYHSRYLDCLESARGELFRSASIPFAALQEQGFIFPVIECRLRYKAPARYDDLLDIALWVSDLQRVRIVLEYDIRRATGESLVEAQTVLACTRLDEKPQRIPERVRQALLPYSKLAGNPPPAAFS